MAIFALFCFGYRRKPLQIGNSSSRRAATITIRANGADSCPVLSGSSVSRESHCLRCLELEDLKRLIWFRHQEHSLTRDFGPVYKAQTLAGKLVAVKVLLQLIPSSEKKSSTAS